MFQPFEGSIPFAEDGATQATSHRALHWVREIKRGHQHYQVDPSLEGAHDLDLEDRGRRGTDTVRSSNYGGREAAKHSTVSDLTLKTALQGRDGVGEKHPE